MGQQHYRFAYGYLKGFAFERTAELREALWTDPEGFLPWLWERSIPGESAPCPGLAARTFMHGELAVALITLPLPEKPAEAYFVLILFDATVPKFYSLEKAASLWEGDDSTGTVLGLWEPDRRYNLGEGPSPDADLFVARVLSMVDERSSEGS